MPSRTTASSGRQGGLAVPTLIAIVLAALSCESLDRIESPLNQPPDPARLLAPDSGATNVLLEPELVWEGAGDPDGDAVVFEVHLGAAEPLPRIGTASATVFRVQPALAPATEFRWRVVTRDSRGAGAESRTWTFRTIAAAANQPPAPITDPAPRDGARDVAIVAALAWSGGEDPEGGAVVFDVHVAIPPAPLVRIGSTSQRSADPSGPGADLLQATTYLWRIDARDAQGLVTSGPVWSFITAAAPNAPPSAPDDPIPASGAAGVDPAVVLSWGGGVDPDSDPVTFDVYLGTSDPPPFAGTATGPSYDPPGDLAGATAYVWMVVARDDRGGEARGPVWGFTTGAPPNRPPSVPSSPDPVNGALGVALDAVLSWSGGADPDGDPVAFDIYFGTEDPPLFAGTAPGPSYDPPGDLDPLTAYHWRIVARDDQGAETSSGTWTFTTAP